MPRTGLLAGALAAFVAAPAAGQSLDARIAAAPQDADVAFHYAAKPGVCGIGSNIMRISDEDVVTERRGGRTYLTGSRWMDDCEAGPVHIRLERVNGRVTGLNTTVGGSARAGAIDLGAVQPAEAVRYLLDRVVRDGASKAGKDAVFAATIADGVDPWQELLAIARDEAITREVRKAAVFWVGQAAAARATDGLTELVGDDGADSEVRKSAVFALSQRPQEEGVPALIELARTARDPEVRKAALFWLGQSDDPRALRLFEEILLSGR